jgi:hypothetical protein
MQPEYFLQYSQRPVTNSYYVSGESSLHTHFHDSLWPILRLTLTFHLGLDIEPDTFRTKD